MDIRSMGKAAYMEDADEESGQALGGTRVAASVAPSPHKEKANSKKSRRSGSISPHVYGQNDSDSTILPPRRREKEPRPRPRDKEERMGWERHEPEQREREPRRSSTKKSSAPRPGAKTSKTSPVVQQYPPRKPKESEYYGVPQSTGSSGQRFRSSAGTPHSGGVPITGGGGARSMSYHGKAPHPPPSNQNFYSTSPYGSSLSSYPQQPYGSPYGSPYNGPSHPLAHHPSLPPGSPVDSYANEAGNEHLKHRFQSGARPAPRPTSAMG
ncbi:hypothetical protein IMZ48_41790, partial [Candidatus Bathyarchaeota archaeon]|nr:hypothetical protein [Candidatus Bathyarchaeota archaeon]